MRIKHLNMAVLTDKQVAILEEFRLKVQDVIDNDNFFEYYPQRWLIAKSWNTSLAEKMLREAAEWRRKQNVEAILTTWKVPEVIANYSPGGIAGFDKEGSPVWIEPMGRMDARGLMASVKTTDLIRNRIFIVEKCGQLNKAQCEKTNKYNGGVVMIYDFEQFGLKHFWKPGIDLTAEMFAMCESNFPELLKFCYVVKGLDFVSQIVETSERYYPEQHKSVFIVRAPKIFYAAFRLIKPFLHEETRKKIHILGSDWKEKLREVIDGDQLPVYWGGTMTDPDGDECCRSKVCMGGEVPHSYYSKNTYVIEPSSLTEISILRRSVHDVVLNVDVPTSIIRWQFHTLSHDIGFGLYRILADDNDRNSPALEPLIDSRRVNSQMVPEEGSALAEKPGKYIFRFNNKYSWITKKQLFYQLDVLPPDDFPNN